MIRYNEATEYLVVYLRVKFTQMIPRFLFDVDRHLQVKAIIK